MAKTLPKGLRGREDVNGNLIIKVPPWPHKRYVDYWEWCFKTGIISGFSL